MGNSEGWIGVDNKYEWQAKRGKKAVSILSLIFGQTPATTVAAAIASLVFAGIFAVVYLLLSEAFAYSGALKLISAFVVLIPISILIKYPDRYSSTGGLTLETSLAVIIASVVGVLPAFLYVLSVIVIGGYMIKEGPQYMLASITIHAGLILIASTIAITAANLLWVCMGLILLGFSVGYPIYRSMGNPRETLILYTLVSIVWNYVILKTFGVAILGMLVV